MPESEASRPATLMPFDAAGAPGVNPTLCLNARYKAVACTRCVAGCPTAAINLTATQLPTLTEDACVHCGACSTLCPTDVFSLAVTPEAKLCQTMEQLPLEPVAVVCSWHPTPTQTHAPVTAVVQHRRCLAALGLGDLLALSAAGRRPLWLDDSVCGACPIGQVQGLLAQNVTTSQALLAAHGCHGVVQLASQSVGNATQPPIHRPVIDGGQPKVSRRGLFSLVRAAVTHDHDALNLSETPADHPLPTDQRLPQTLPVSRRHLLAQLARLPAAPAATLSTQEIPLAAINVAQEACSGCGLCARFCPTGALQFNREAETFQLTFRAAYCLDCGVCLTACPEKAVTCATELVLADLQAQSASILAAGVLLPCAVCGLPTAQRPQDGAAPRCYACRYGAGVVTSQRDAAGLMADLLRRIGDSPYF